ncbi:MAG: hypothetical protein KC413_25515, partial [Anaerolineales bacterium]|nr:hypothetical protein [Anaerolineales bacterium]
MNVIWTVEQVAGIAPSNHLLKTGRSFAQVEKWLSLHQNSDAVWGIFPLGKEKLPVQTGIVVDDLQMMCSCSSRSFPCAHALGLLQLVIERPSTFTVSTSPEWLVQWQQEVQKRIESQRRRDTAVPPPHQQQKRLATIQAGLAELELWLHDLVRNGLAAARHKP